MAFLSITIPLAREQADLFADALMATGALSVSVEDADEGSTHERAIFGEPGAAGGLWDRCLVTALFADGMDGQELVWQAAGTLGIETLNFTTQAVADTDWVRQTQSQFPPIQISPRITIVPSWHEAVNRDSDAINIVLDPGAAFGTGSHPTTRLCLQWLETQLNGPAAVLDYGTGSGILAIAAAKLGATDVVGVDIDVAAIEAARYNASQNAVDITLSTTDTQLHFLADITVANILANPLRVLAPLLAAHTKPGGKLALAGILDEQADDIIAIYAPYFALSVWRNEEGWACIAGTRH
jgi:ribosomal protein L11 methyltransferase